MKSPDRVYYMYDFGGDVKYYKDFWSNEDPLKYFPWLKNTEDLVLVKVLTERDYYISQIPEEFHIAIEQIAYDYAHACGDGEVVRVIGDLAHYLVPCFEEYKKNLLSGSED